MLTGFCPDVYAPAPLARTRHYARPRGAHRPARVSAPGTDTDIENRESPFVYVSHRNGLRSVRESNASSRWPRARGHSVGTTVTFPRVCRVRRAAPRSSWIVGSEGEGLALSRSRDRTRPRAPACARYVCPVLCRCRAKSKHCELCIVIKKVQVLIRTERGVS